MCSFSVNDLVRELGEKEVQLKVAESFKPKYVTCFQFLFWRLPESAVSFRNLALEAQLDDRITSFESVRQEYVFFPSSWLAKSLILGIE
jgi:hypothetical protein